jgi:hypothetical protein
LRVFADADGSNASLASWHKHQLSFHSAIVFKSAIPRCFLSGFASESIFARDG